MSSSLRLIVKAYDNLIFGMAVGAAVLCVCLSLWVTYDVLLRYVVKQPTSWVIDLSEYALVWICFLSAPWLLKKGGHIKIELLTERLGPISSRIFEFVACLIGAAACFILFWQSAETTFDYFQKGVRFAKAWNLYVFIPYLVIPIGSLLCGIEFLRLLGRPKQSASTEKQVVHSSTTPV